MLSSTDLPLSPDSPLLSDSADIDFGCDSGIEAEMDEPHGKMHLVFLLYFIHADALIHSLERHMAASSTFCLHFKANCTPIWVITRHNMDGFPCLMLPLWRFCFKPSCIMIKKKTEHYPFWLITYTTTPENIFDSLLIKLKILILQMSVFFFKNLFYFK